MCEIKLKEIMEGKSYPEAGTFLYQLINENIICSKKIILNMDGVTSVPSMFLNVSIGKYLEENGPDSLKGKLSFAQITKVQAERIKAYIEKIQYKES